MTALANILLFIALAATVGLAISLMPANQPGGPDRAMYGWVCILVQMPRWACVTIALLIAARQSLPWPQDRLAQVLIVLAVQIIIGGGCVICSMVAVTTSQSDEPRWASLALLAVPIVVPLLPIALAAFAVNSPADEAGHRPAAIGWGWAALAGLAVLVLIVGLSIYVRDEWTAGRERQQADSDVTTSGP